MSLSAAEIALVVREVKKEICPGKLEQIYQAQPTEITWKVRKEGASRFLLVSAHPVRSRIHLLSERPQAPPGPPDFCRSLRNHLTGSLLEDIEQEPDDRLVHLRFRRGSEPKVFVAELTGRGSHLLLLDGSGEILAALRPYRGRRRVLIPGRPYVPPPPPAERRPSTVRENLRDAESPSRAAESLYQEEEARSDRAERTTQLAKALRKGEKKALAAVRKIENALAAAEGWEVWRRMGEALKASLGRLEKGISETTVPDPYSADGTEIRVPLDPSLSPVGNMEALFKKARKMRRGRAPMEERLLRARANLKEVRDVQSLLTSDADDAALSRIEKAAEQKRLLRRAPTPAKRRAKEAGPRRFSSRDGIEIWVGRTSSENERMTFRMARGEDLFLHVDGRPGAHVIVRLDRKMSVPEETLLDAAELAAHFSGAKGQEKVQVIYTPRKHVKRPRRRKTGEVMVARQRTLLLEREPARLRRLLESAKR